MKKLITILAIALTSLSFSCVENEDPTPCRKLNRMYYELEYFAVKGEQEDVTAFETWKEANKDALAGCPTRSPNPLLE